MRPGIALLISALALAGSARAARQAEPPLSTVRAFNADEATNPNQIDESIAAGPASLMLAYNGGISLRSKTGVAIQYVSLVGFFDTVRVNSEFMFDPRVLYDELSSRFFVLAAARFATSSSHLYLAVSKTPSPGSLGPADWHFFALDPRTENGGRREWVDFPSLGVNENAVVITAQMFPTDGPATADNKVLKIRVLDKGALLSGALPAGRDWVDFRDPQSNALLRAALQPVQHFGRGAPAFVVGGAASVCGFVIFGFDTSTTPAALTSRVVATPDGSCRQAPDAPQPDDKARLAVNGGLRVPAVYRNGYLWIAEAVGRTFGNVNTGAIRVTQLDVRRWPETPTLVQQPFLFDENAFRYYPALVVDAENNVGLVFGQSSRSQAASLYISGRLATDPVGTLRPPVLIRHGDAAMNLVADPSRGAASFGDYFSAALDPISGTMWVLGEYASTATAFRRHAGEYRIR